MTKFKLAALSIGVAAALSSNSVLAQDANKEESALETITVTAQKRVQSIQDVPISIATLSGEKFDSIFAAGDDILALAVRVPGLYAESSNGRVAPRFYIRGLGNTDFDLAASQPVSIVMDDVVMENVVLKSTPLFDVQQVEVIRGPQGTLFGRNTTAGIIKFDTVKPTQDFDAYAKLGLASYGTVNFEGAVGGGLTDSLSGRFSVLSQDRDDYIDNAFSGQDDVIGGFSENAWRGQLLYTPNDDLSVLAKAHGRSLKGTASIFRANVLSPGSNELNENYDRETVYYDANLTSPNGFDNNPQEYEGFGASLKVDYDFGDVTLTSITASETADGFSLGDVDGGAGSGDSSVPGFIPFTAVTQDNLDDLEQFTQEIRFASDTDSNVQWQAGAFYFDSSFNVTSIDGFFGATTVFHDNTTWAVFGQSTVEVDDSVSFTGGLRYTHDEKSFRVGEQNVDGFALVIGAAQVQDYEDINVDDGRLSFEFSANVKYDDNTSFFARYANGFRAQSIQGRNVAFEDNPTVADAETISSVEVGVKSDLANDSVRINAALFYYTIDDIQLSAIGGDANGNALLNADKGQAKGFEIDATWIATENLVFTAGYSYNDTELKDSTLLVGPCGAPCTVLDPMIDGRARINGNPFPQAPKTILTFTARYSKEVPSGEIFAYTDWSRQGETNLFLYESLEFSSNGNVEGGLRLGYENYNNNYSVAAFGRNITNRHNLVGAIDFNNLTGIVNKPAIFGIEFKKSFF